MLRFKRFKQDEARVLELAEKVGTGTKNGERTLRAFRSSARVSYEDQLECYRMYQRLLDMVIREAEKEVAG